MRPLTATLLLFSVTLALTARDVSGAIIYRIGTPFSPAEKDSLDAIGIGFEEIDWSLSQLEDALEVDSLRAGVLQPNFFAEDEDIAATAFGRDGWVAVSSTYGYWNTQVGEALLDQDSTTSWGWPAVAAESFEVNARVRSQGVLVVLGGRFLIKEVRFRPLVDRPEHFLERFTIGFADEGYNKVRIPSLPTLLEVKENTEPEVSVIIDPPVTSKAVQLLISRDTPKEIGIADFEVYGGGFVGTAAYESDVIELDDLASWGEIRWSGRRDPQARVDIRTRLGTDPQPVVFWESRVEQQDSVKFQQGGGDLSFQEYRRQYDKLSDFLKPINKEHWVSSDTENWSFWSSSYVFENSGVGIVSPGPRQYIQLRADFQSTVDDGGDRLRRVQGVGSAIRPPPGGGDSSNRNRSRRAYAFHVLHQADDPLWRHQL